MRKMNISNLLVLIFLFAVFEKCLGNNWAITAIRVDSSIISIDGFLNEPYWQQADSVFNFVQAEPWQDAVATEATAVRVLTDVENLYVSFQCRHFELSKIQAWLATQDKSRGDRVTVFLSGTGNNETGYLFRVNAAGVQTDAYIIADGRQNDLSWNGVWFSAVHRDSTGWSAELKIPFKTMRFLPNVQWKIGFARYISRKNESDFWPAVKVQQSLRISRLAKLEGIMPGRPGLNLELYPVGLVKYDRIADRKYSANGGLNFSWSPTPATRLDFTANPDFAQIESDPDRINLGRFELYFQEKRPFFIEGADKFKTPIQLFYSRRIGKKLPDGQEVPILSAGKFQSSFGQYDISILSAVCEKVDYTDWDGNQKTEPQSVYPVIRLKRCIGKNSLLGLFYGAKENDREYNRLYAIDGTWRTAEMEWQNQIAVSSDKEVKKGFAYKSAFDWNSRYLIIKCSSEKYEPNFAASEIGYVTYNGESHQVSAGPIWYQKGVFQNFYIGGEGIFSKLVGDAGYTKVGAISLSPNFQKWGFSTNVHYGRAYEKERWYDYWHFSLWFWPNSEGRLFINPGIQYDSWSYNYRRGFFAPHGSIDLYASYNLRSNMQLAWQGNNTLEWKPDKSFEKSSWIHEFWYNWSLTRDLHFKLYYTPNWETHYHKVNLLFSYNFAPKSWIYLAFNEGIDNSTAHPKTKEQVITLKVSRLFWW
ncbi:MAG: DUF5916 domain-containing protein [Candidatus Edwardsbacteria bacterium]